MEEEGVGPGPPCDNSIYSDDYLSFPKAPGLWVSRQLVGGISCCSAQRGWGNEALCPPRRNLAKPWWAEPLGSLQDFPLICAVDVLRRDKWQSPVDTAGRVWLGAIHELLRKQGWPPGVSPHCSQLSVLCKKGKMPTLSLLWTSFFPGHNGRPPWASHGSVSRGVQCECAHTCSSCGSPGPCCGG